VNNFDLKRNAKAVLSLVPKDKGLKKWKEDERPDDDLSERYLVDELLVSAGEMEMDLETADEILADPEADPELKKRAHELLGESDHTGADSELRESSIIKGNAVYEREVA
jgi:hypothetical protein